MCFAAFGSTCFAELISFDRLPSGVSPAGWIATNSGKGSAQWTVERDASAPSPSQVLKQSGTASFTVCLLPKSLLVDGFVQVKFKALDGKDDQAAGLVWRAQDAQNYYVCRANSLENNVVLYKMVEGQRKALDIVGRSGGYGVKEPVQARQWHQMRVEFTGRRFKVLFNGKQLFEVEDDSITDAGIVGVWTKADSVTVFDDFEFGRK